MSDADTVATGLEAFGAEVREWIEEKFPRSLKGRQQLMMTEVGPIREQDFAGWKKAMGERGWGTPTWPTQYGGGLSPVQARVLQQEMSRVGAWNPIGGMGVMMFGPTLLEHGNEEQKRRHIPGIAKGDVRWCQGYSKPGAGSDLAALRTQCVDSGDYFLVNGQKIWTSGAQYADWCFCLVRTDNTRKHEGISFLLIDMKTPGVEVRPIKLISGNSPFCELFFTDVKVPKENLVGALNRGWTIGKRLLQHERGGLSAGILIRSNEHELDRIAKDYSADVAQLASLAKARAGNLVHLVSNEMVQMHGGIGMTDEHDAGLYLKRARVQEATFGAASYHRDRYATLLGY
jgi:alkylation response protein AidB-like acyl-CoA dehydrogenase